MKRTLAPAGKSTFSSEARRLRINFLLTQQDFVAMFRKNPFGVSYGVFNKPLTCIHAAANNPG